MLPAVTRTAIAAVTALAMAAASVAPAQALGKNERNVLKGVLAAVVVQQLLKQSRAHAQPAPSPYPVQPQPYPQPYPQPDYHVNAAAAAFNEFSPQARRMIQQRLAAYGYYRGAIDGTWGRGTAAAVQGYARDTKSSASLSSRDGSIQLYNHLIG